MTDLFPVLKFFTFTGHVDRAYRLLISFTVDCQSQLLKFFFKKPRSFLSFRQICQKLFNLATSLPYAGYLYVASPHKFSSSVWVGIFKVRV